MVETIFGFTVLAGRRSNAVEDAWNEPWCSRWRGNKMTLQNWISEFALGCIITSNIGR